MNQLYIILALVFFLCFTIYQWWFQGSRFKQMSERDIKKVGHYNRPIAWLLYSISIFIIIIVLIGYNIMSLMESVMNLDL